jgi:hypothetical protein
VSAVATNSRDTTQLLGLFEAARVALEHAGAGETGARIVDSVLRPLAEAVTGKRLRARSQASRTPDASATDAELAELVWSLAQRASQLGASWTGDSRQLTKLIEATAALQDLALRTSPGEERPARMAVLTGILAGCAGEIRCAHDGPYLVTNAEHVRN